MKPLSFRSASAGHVAESAPLIGVQALLLLTVLFPSPTAGQNRKLNGPLAREIVGDVHGFRLSEDGSRVVYLANQATQAARLYAAPCAGGAPPVELTSGPVDAITAFEIAGCGDTVVYLQRELLRVSADGSLGSVALSAPLEPPERVADFRLAPAGGWIAYRVAGIPGEEKLFGVRLDRRGGAIPLAQHVGRATLPYRITPDGARVVYSTGVALWSVPIHGLTEPVELNAGHPARADIIDFRISADSKCVVYRADPERGGVFELYAAPSDGGSPPVKLSAPLVTGGDVQQGFEIAGGRVVYRADQERNDVLELYSAPLDARFPPVRLNSPLVAGGDVLSFELAPDGATLVYCADEVVDEVARLYLAPIDGSSGRAGLGTTLGADRSVSDFRISPAGGRVVYRARLGAGFGLGLYTSSFASPEQAVPLREGITIYDFLVGPDGGRVVFSEPTGETTELCSVRSDGSSQPTTLAADAPLESRITVDGRRVVFVTDLIDYEANELFSVPIEGGAPPIRLNGALLAGQVIGDVESFGFARDGAVVFKAEGSTLDPPILPDQLHRLELGKRARPVRLFPWDRFPNDVFQYVVSPDGSRLVFTAGNDPAEVGELYSTPLDGTHRAVQLSDPSGAYFSIGRFEVTPDGRTVVYLQTSDEPDEPRELYAVPVDRLSDPVELDADLPAGGSVLDFHVSPTGKRLVYHARLGPAGDQLFLVSLPPSGDPQALLRLPAFPVSVQNLRKVPLRRRLAFLADLESDEVFELYTTDGKRATKHSGRLVAGGDVSDYALASDGARAVYLADQERDGVLELFGVTLAGSAPVVKLSGGPQGGSSWSFRITSDARRVVYLTDQYAAGVFELHSVAIDGSAPAVKLSGNLVAGGDVRTFQLAPDGLHVVYVADSAVDEVFELFAAPLAGGAAPTRLSDPLVAGGDVRTDFALSPDGRWVAYAADQRADEVFELFRVPIDHSVEPVPCSGPLVAGGDIAWSYRSAAFGFTPDSSRLLYVADQDEDEVFELYESWIGRPLLPSVTPDAP